MKYLASWRWGCLFGDFDLVGRYYLVTLSGRPAIQLACDLCLAYLCVPNLKHRLQKMLLMEKI